jgi:adenylate kinase family enzyme
MQVDYKLRQAKKIVLIGCSGAGKTTLAEKLAAQIGVAATDLDNIRFVDGFASKKRPVEDFIKDVKKIATQPKWVVEGVYYKYGIQNELWGKADVVVWLDYPLWLIEYRTLRRSICRILKKQTKPTGTLVSCKTEFGKNGLLRVLHKIHKATRKYYPDLLQNIDNESNIVIVRNSNEYKKLLNALLR